MELYRVVILSTIFTIFSSIIYTNLIKVPIKYKPVCIQEQLFLVNDSYKHISLYDIDGNKLKCYKDE